MKKFIGTILLVASIMLALLTGIGTFIIGFKILKMLFTFFEVIMLFKKQISLIKLIT